MNYVGECDSDSYLCKECEGDCDSDSDCEGDLVCMERDGYESVPGCVGEGGGNDLYEKDICYNPTSTSSSGELPIETRALNTSTNLTNPIGASANSDVYFRIRSTNANLCLHAQMPAKTPKIVVQVCDETDDLQRFRSDEQGRLVPKASPNKCIFTSKKGLKLRKCGVSAKNNAFLFNIFDSTVKWSKSTSNVFSIRGDSSTEGAVVILANKQDDSSFQQWSLVPDTPSIHYVGNPCNGEDGKCGLCTGDCDSDSDCEGNLRCAQRYGSDGFENVPGCAWGEGSDDVRLDDDDFCKLQF